MSDIDDIDGIVVGSQIIVDHKNGNKFTLTVDKIHGSTTRVVCYYRTESGRSGSCSYSKSEMKGWITKGSWVKVDITHPHTVKLPEELFEI